MDWLDRDNVNILLEEEADSFSQSNIMNIENLFLQKQPSMNDFEFKLEDFQLNNRSEEQISKLPFNMKENDEGFTFNQSLTPKKKIFEIDKNQKKLNEEGKKNSSQYSLEKLNKQQFNKIIHNRKEEQLNKDNNQFKYKNNSSVASLDDGSDFMTSTKNEADQNFSPITEETTESNKKRTNNYNGTYSDDSDIEGDSLMNNNSDLDELEEKRLIYNLYNNTNNSIRVKETDKDFKDYQIATANFPCSGNSCPFFIPLQSLPLSERMKIKKEKAKMLLEKKRENNSSLNFLPKLFASQPTSNLNTSTSTNPINLSENTHSNTNTNSNSNNNSKQLNEEYTNDLNSSHLSKKEIKMLRNRISAQRSRDRKKKEMDDLKLISQDLLNETYFLRKQLETKDKELREMKEKLSIICDNCKKYVTKDKIAIGTTIRKDEIIGPAKTYNIVDSSSQRIATNLKYSLMAGFLVVVCLLGTLAINSKKENIIDNYYQDSDLHGRVLLTKPQNQNGLMLYKSESSLNYPFSITKDLDKFIKKQTKYLEQEDEYSYLKRKRMNFLSKIESKQGKMVLSNDSEEVGFLKHKIRQEKDHMCYDIDDKLELSIKLEDNLIEEENSGIVLKEEHKDLDYTGVVPLNYRENSLFKENIKSMYCKDFLTTAEENGKLFKSLFDKINEKEKFKLGSR
jgi:hypothetical protein